jgi:small subunit ribosomal protein S9
MTETAKKQITPKQSTDETAETKPAVKKAAPAKKPAAAAKPIAAPASQAKAEVKNPIAVKKEKTTELKIASATYATGKRKDSVARVYLALGKVQVIVNGRPMIEYFKRKVLQLIVEQPFAVANVSGRYDVRANVAGGGLSGQAGAIKHGISKALQSADPALRGALKKAGFLTRDSRVVERKHFGHHKARRSTQFSKR